MLTRASLYTVSGDPHSRGLAQTRNYAKTQFLLPLRRCVGGLPEWRIFRRGCVERSAAWRPCRGCFPPP